MGNILYLECYSGISGDMTVAALLDLGADRKVLDQVLASLPVQGFSVKVSRVIKSGIDACNFDVVLEEDNHDHDMEFLHGHSHGEGHGHEHEDGHEHEHSHEHDHGYEHDHSHEHDHGHEHEHSHDHAHSHSHVQRGMAEIGHIIACSDMTEGASYLALKIFTVLAEAEAKAHHVPMKDVHFHEVGAVDSIVDIISVAVCLDNLGITEVIIPELWEGRGTVRCQHGILPVPVPAVANIVSANNLKLRLTSVQGELVTPTGAAIAAAVMTTDCLPEEFQIKKIGIGAGKRQYECPGILRAMLIEKAGKGMDEDIIFKLETNIDDCTGENLGYVMERLFEAGARDVNYAPVFMKKNRPAWLLTVICKEEDIPALEQIIFNETTTIGIRRAGMKRTILKREARTVSTPIGEAKVKVCFLNGEEKVYPEYESVAALCRESGRSYGEVYQMVKTGKTGKIV